MGVLRLSNNWIDTRSWLVYIEIVRNIPLLLQFIFWQTAVFHHLSAEGARGHTDLRYDLHSQSRFHRPQADPRRGELLCIRDAFVVAIGVVIGYAQLGAPRQDETGEQFPVLWTSLGI